MANQKPSDSPKVEVSENDIEKVSYPAPMQTELLFKMLLDTQRQLAESQKELAESIRESRKPYVDPAVLEAKKQALQERKKQVALELLKRRETKRVCLHKRTNSDGSFHEKYNIKWQMHSNGIILGVCGTCGSQFDARNADDRKFLQLDGTSARNMGMARGTVAEGRNSYAV